MDMATHAHDRMAIAGHDDRSIDLERHLDDLRTGTHDGREAWPDKVKLFRQEVDLLDPVATHVLATLNMAWLDGTGDVTREDTSDDPEGHLVSRWSLRWPDQEAAGVDPVVIAARYAPGRLHPHLGGTRARDWPFAVYDDADADRQEPLLRLIAEAELHQRIFDADWRVVSGYRRRHADS